MMYVCDILETEASEFEASLVKITRPCINCEVYYLCCIESYKGGKIVSKMSSSRFQLTLKTKWLQKIGSVLGEYRCHKEDPLVLPRYFLGLTVCCSFVSVLARWRGR